MKKYQTVEYFVKSLLGMIEICYIKKSKERNRRMKV